MRFAPIATLVLLIVSPGTAGAQSLKTVRVAGGELRAGERVVKVTGGFVDPRTGRGRVEHRRGVLRLGGNVRSIRTRALRTKITTSGGKRLRLRLAHLLFVGGTTTLHLDPGLGLEATGTTFAIVGGRLDARDLRGTLGHTGTLTLSRGDRSLSVFDLGLEVPRLTAQVWDFRAPIAELAVTRRRVAGHEADLDATATVTGRVAEELNQAFEVTTFHDGMALGTLAVRGRLRG